MKTLFPRREALPGDFTPHQSFSRKTRNSGKIGAGTDGGGQTGDQFIGWTMHTELENMVAAGMTPAQVLTAATRVSAGILQLDDLGMVVAGKRVLFVVL